MNTHYSAQSRRAKECGVELLALTQGIEDLPVPAGLGVRPLAVLGLIARARHLLKTVHTTADVGDVLGSALASRAINESVLTLGWLSTDPEMAELVWMLDEIRSRLSHHRDAQAEERRQRRRAKRKGKKVPPVLPGKSLGILDRKMVRYLKKTEAETKARTEKMKKRARRLKRLKVKRINRMPGFGDRAAVAGLSWAYHYAYRYDSNAVAHPSPLAVERFLDVRHDGIHVLGEPRGSVPDPYVVSARLFAALLELAGHHVDISELEPGLTEIHAKLEDLAAEVAGDPGS